MQEQDGDQTVGRRRLLRQAGAVAAGIAGAGAVSAATASPAQANPGDPVVQGVTNNAGSSATSLTNNAALGPTLRLQNTATTGGQAGPALQLVPNDELLAYNAPTGSMSVDFGGNLWISNYYGDGSTTFPELVHTTRNSNYIAPITPTRILDTRTASGRAFILNPSGNINSSGQLLAFRTIQLDLSGLVTLGDAAFINITVTGQANNGFVQVWPTGLEQPNTSNVNYVRGQDISNFALTTIGWVEGTSDDVISVFSTQNTHVIIDVTAFVLSYGFVGGGASSAASAADTAAKELAEKRMRKARKNRPAQR